MIRIFGAALCGAALLAGCGGHDTNGPCSQDSECTLCEVCGCVQVYSAQDLNGASCDQVASDETCPPQPSDDCVNGPFAALCVSGHCQRVAR